jgi:hypothetical protein
MELKMPIVREQHREKGGIKDVHLCLAFEPIFEHFTNRRVLEWQS